MKKSHKKIQGYTILYVLFVIVLATFIQILVEGCNVEYSFLNAVWFVLKWSAIIAAFVSLVGYAIKLTKN